MIEIGDRPKGGRFRFRTGDKWVYADTLEEKPLALTVAYMIEKGLNNALVKIEEDVYLIKLSGNIARYEKIEISEEVSLENFASSIEEEEPIHVIEAHLKEWEKKYSPRSRTRLYIYGGLSLIVLAVFFGAYTKVKSDKKTVTEPKGPVIIRLTQEEKRKQIISVSYLLLKEIAQTINRLKQGQRLKSVQASYSVEQVQVSPDLIKEVVKGKINIVEEYVYPVKGSRRSGDFYTRSRSMEVLPAFTEKGQRTFTQCGLMLAKNGIHLTEPDKNLFKGSVREWEKSKKLLTKLQGCNIELRAISLSPAGMSVEVVLHD